MSWKLTCRGLSTRDVNRALRAAILEGHTTLHLMEPDARHNLAVALLQPVRVVVEGSVGYYCGGMMDGATIEIQGNAGWGTAESMLNGTVLIDGNAGSAVAASIRGGTVVVRRDASSRAGVSMKGGTLIVGGNCGAMAGFMMQKGTIVIVGDVGEAVGDSMYEGIIYVGGAVASLGNDAVIADADADETRGLGELLEAHALRAPARFRKIVSGRKLWNFDRNERELWKVAL